MRPIDVLLSVPDESDEYAQCPDGEILNSFWSKMSLLMGFAEEPMTWEGPFGGGIERALEVHLGFSNPNACHQSVWITGDATPTTAACVNWAECQFPRCDSTALVNEFIANLGSGPTIAEVEAVTSVCGVVLWAGVCGERRIIAVGADSANVFSLLRRGKAGAG